MSGSVSRENAGSGILFGVPDSRIAVLERTGPRLTSQDIEDHNRQPNTNILCVERNAGFSCFQGAFPVHMNWIMPRREYQHRSLGMAWPEPTEETITTEGVWAGNNMGEDDSEAECDETATQEMEISKPQEPVSAIDKLDMMGSRLLD